MDIDEKLAAELGIALNESSLAGVEYVADHGVVAATFVCLTLPEVGPEPEDRRRQFVFHRVGRITASLRLGWWNEEKAPVKPFDVSELLTVVQSFGCQPIYGWEFFNVDKRDLASWSDRLSLDISIETGSMKNSICLFQEGNGKQHLDLCVWFESFTICDATGEEISVDDFTAGGMRWWEAMHAGDDRTQGHGIIGGK